MQWILDNWLIILLVGGMLAMHLFGHGHGHGKGRDQHDKSSDAKSGTAPASHDGKTDETESNRDPEA